MRDAIPPGDLRAFILRALVDLERRCASRAVIRIVVDENGHEISRITRRGGRETGRFIRRTTPQKESPTNE